MWPPAAQTDAFLNRAMRASLGLSAPERRIGQTTHDFVAALGASQAILSRAKKRGGSPTVASRFLQRLGAVAGEPAIAAMERRGERWLNFARRLDRPETTTPIARPEPRPPLNLRPTKLSVTRIEALRRDPYAIYAERILDLCRCLPVGAVAGFREIGTVWHAALEEFAETAPPHESEEEARRRLFAAAERAFAPLNADPAFRALRWPRIVKGLEEFLAFDAERRAEASALYFELDGALDIVRSRRPDVHIDRARRPHRDLAQRRRGDHRLQDRRAAGRQRSDRRLRAAADAGSRHACCAAALPKSGPQPTKALIYFKLGGAEGGVRREVKAPKETSLEAVIESHFAGLKQLVAQFASAETPYLSRPFPKFAGRGSDYDHLARVKEWSATGDGGDEE